MELGGKPMLEWAIDAALRSRVERVVVLITRDQKDIAIADACDHMGVEYHIGSDNRDILGDFYTVATDCGFDPIVRVTADCPLLSPLVITSVINEYFNGCDYCSNVVERTYPRGLDVEVVSYAILKWLHENITPERTPWHEYDPDYRKHVTLYIRSHPHTFNIRSIVLNLSKLRLTVDTQDEYDKLSAVFDLMSDEPSWLQAAEIANAFPELASLETADSQTKALGKVW